MILRSQWENKSHYEICYEIASWIADFTLFGYTHLQDGGPYYNGLCSWSAQWAKSEYEWAPHCDLGLGDGPFPEGF